MKWFIMCLVFIWSVSFSTSSHQSYQIKFPPEKDLSRAKLRETIKTALTEYTLCHWFRVFSENYEGAIFSYNVGNVDNVILSYLEPEGTLEIWHPKSVKRTSSDYLAKGDWVHSCITWSSIGGRWQIYVNGKRAAFGTGLSTNEQLPANGTVILGQEQDKEDDAYDKSQRLIGYVSEVHLWNYVLTVEDMNYVYHCVPKSKGNVINWESEKFTVRDGAEDSRVYLPCGDRQFSNAEEYSCETAMSNTVTTPRL